ncbi:hypothetical protein ABIB62_004714 [Mucilaginibacter sp. UYP25]|uniref:hypothetical protein n=1 Tax=unclassified Mucilaginibacter TaxID=2617802 RepID=UPI003397C333
MKRNIPFLALTLLVLATGCSKKDSVKPVTNHEVTFSTTSNGYKTVISLQTKGTAEEEAKVLTSATNTGTNYSYKTTITTGDHLLITISPNGANSRYHYQIDDNGSKTDEGDVTVAIGTSFVLHYPKSSN